MALWYKNIKNNDIFTTDTHSRVPRASKNLEDIFEDHFGELERKDSAQIGKKFKKPSENSVFYENFGSILTVFHSFIKFGWI